ncbi:hypothetical protein [Nocardia miyunensis]|uniref:hypothetical protein n=1 Tax=Nocardia miyunensis TaxID=282684 RepID=UPI0008327238|nr:hypothetical protein [Nocardia miyunensis]
MDGVDTNIWRNLLGQANSGELYLDPETGKGLDKVCDDHIQKLNSVLQSIQFVSRITGFGSFNSSQVLEKKFSSLASGGDRALDTVIKQHIDAINITKEVVAKAIANYVALDEEQRAKIEKLKP